MAFSRPKVGAGNGGFNKYTGQQGGGMSSNTGGGGGADYFGQAGDKLGFGTRKQDDAANKMAGNGEAAYGETQGVLANMKKGDDDYLHTTSKAHNTYQSSLQDATEAWGNKNSQLQSDSESQGKDAHAAYTNTILPKMKDNMESAMTLKEAQDPNNKVASGVRDMYNTQAQGIQNQGVADYGVLAALGSQATQNTAGGGGVFTGGQMQAMQGANMGQAGQAMSNAQAYANKLKVQGISAGQEQSNWAYGKGQDAGQDYQNAIHNDVGQQAGFRQEQSGFNTGTFNATMAAPSDDYNFKVGQAGAAHGFNQQQGNQQIAATGQKYGVQNAALGMKANAAGAQNAGKMGMLASGVGAVGNAMGGMMGGGGGGGKNGQPGANGQNGSAGNTGGGTYEGPGSTGTGQANTESSNNGGVGGQNTSDQSTGGGNQFDGGSGNGMSTALYGGQQDYNGGQGGGVGSYVSSNSYQQQQAQQDPYGNQRRQPQRRAYA